MKECTEGPLCQVDARSDSEQLVMISGQLKETAIGPEG